MRGFPFLNLLIALLVSGAVLLPLVWRSTRVADAQVMVHDDPPAESGDKIPSHVSLRFVHAPAKVRLAAGEKLLHEWAVPNGSLLLEETVPLSITNDRAEFSLHIEWPAGTTDPTNVVVEIEPEKRESRKDIYWSSGGTVDEIVTFSWKP